MTTATTVRRPSSGTLAEVVDILLDKGLVIDAFVRVSLVGIELVTIDARIVLASVDTYLHFAEAVNRLDLREKTEAAGVDDLMGGMGGMGSGMKGELAGNKAKNAVEDGADSVKDKAKSMFGMGDDDDEEDGGDDADENC